MHETPLSAEVTLLDNSKSNPLCSIRDGSYPFCSYICGQLEREIRGGSASDLKEARGRLERVRKFPTRTRRLRGR